MTKTKKPLARSAAELVLIVVIALGLALVIQAFIIKPYEIPSASMEPTLHINQRILVDRIGIHSHAPRRGHLRLHPPASRDLRNATEGENSTGQDGRRACDVPRPTSRRRPTSSGSSVSPATV